MFMNPSCMMRWTEPPVTPPSTSQDYVAGWWYKPDFIINDLNINSALFSPGHDEVASLTSGNGFLTFKGYAYCGEHCHLRSSVTLKC